MKFRLFIILISVVLFSNCKKETSPDPEINDNTYVPTPYVITIPTGFPDLIIPADNPTTVEGVLLGRKLFYDPLLSGNNTQSCGSCHSQAFAFTDNAQQFSTGIDGLQGNRNAPAVINAGWMNEMFWDGRAKGLENQALGPVPNPIEMHLSWLNAMGRLRAHPTYPDLFEKAFGTKQIDSIHVVKAIAQFERILISANSKWDKYLKQQANLTPSEARGFDIYFTEKGDCFHCHGTSLFTDNLFHNNGLDSVFSDPGLGGISGNSGDIGKFKSPTLRNIEYTGPYMHDGRFQTLEEVVDFYSEGVKFSSTIDPLMKQVSQGGIQLSPSEKHDLISYLKTLSDTAFLSNPKFADPF